jgi:hypothetical protein
MDLWIDPERDTLINEMWPDASNLDGDTVQVILEAAQEQCASYAPTLAEDAAVPSSWKVALLMQARATWRSMIAGAGDTIGTDGLAITVYPLDRVVKGLLRPPRSRKAL